MWAKGATHMALLHNSIFRGYNSIFHQAAHVRDADKADFVGYALAWHKFVKTHHDDEEAVLFKKVEALLEDDDVWAETHAEHGGWGRGSYTSAVVLPASIFSPRTSS
jgi:hemerythrin-like domain-containing protein